MISKILLRLFAARILLRQWSLQLKLWVLWTLAVIGAGVQYAFSRHIAGPGNLVGLGIHCVLVGLVGLIVLTKVEMWLQPWRF